MRFGQAGQCSTAAELAKVLHALNSGVLLVDSVTSQLIHWCVGEGRWLCDTILVLDMDDDQTIAKLKTVRDATSIVALSGRLLRGERLQLVQRLTSQLCSTSPLCRSCDVFCTLPPSAHTGLVAGYSESPDESPFLALSSQLEELVRKACPGRKVSVRVSYIPAFLAPVSSDVFFTPAHVGLNTLLPTDVPRINAFLQSQHDQRQVTTLASADINMLPDTVRQHLKCVAHNFSELFGSLKIQEHCFSLGPTSRFVAAELASMPDARTRHKIATSTASVLFVDRSLDLATPMSCGSETLIDTVRAALAPLPGHDVDVAVDMSSLLDVHSSCRHCIAPGCLAHPAATTAQTLLSSFVGRKNKDALMELSRRLVEAISQEKLPMDARRMTTITPALLRGLLEKFRCQGGAVSRHSALLQIAMAAANGVDSQVTAALQHALSVEKVMLLTLAEEGFSSALDQLLFHMQAALTDGDSLGATGYLRLLVILYSAAGESASSLGMQQQSQLQACLEDIILTACANKEDGIRQLVGEKYNKDSVRLFLRATFTQLSGISQARAHLKMFRKLAGGNSESLLQQVARALAAPDKPDLPDVEYHSQYMRNLIKTGFSLFMGGSKPRPSDHPLLIVYVVGGVTGTEAKAIRDQFASAKSEVCVMVGGSSLTTGASLLRQVCCSDPLYDVHI